MVKRRDYSAPRNRRFVTETSFARAAPSCYSTALAESPTMIRRLKEALLTALLVASVSACGSDPGTVDDNEALGEISLQLGVGSLRFNSARYKITGPRGSIKSGTIKLKDATQLSAVIGGLPAAVGYTV